MAEANSSLGENVVLPESVDWSATPSSSPDNPFPSTDNPTIDELALVPSAGADSKTIGKKLDAAAVELEENGTLLSLEESLVWATGHAQEYLFAEYDYLSTTLSLLSELHLWGPRFFESVSATTDADSTGGFYDTSLSVVHDFEVTHRLPYGGSVSATALTNFANTLHSATSSSSKGTTAGLSLEIPLLRGAGIVARETLIQSKRNLVYGARTFERFRRTFFRSIAGDYLNLVVQRQSLANAQRGVESLRQLASRQKALYESGRTRLYDSADAENQALASVARLSQSWERYRLSVDRFKVKIGWPIEEIVRIEPATLGLRPLEVEMKTAVTQALQYRLDLQTEENKVGDAYRRVQNAKNGILSDLDFTASASLPSENNTIADFDSRDVDYLVGITFGVPLDRERDRISVRQNQILLERAKRSLRTSKESVAIEVRSSLRNIEVFQFTLDLQERNVEIAQLGLHSITADPDRVSVLDQTRAISELQSAQDARDSARRDLELSIVDFLLQAGQLRIQQNGNMYPIGTINQSL
ncbi:MAG: TolC family protein [Planctomycetes bacterium]|nr:TolC family protein [Planctomycetota bacterium]